MLWWFVPKHITRTPHIGGDQDIVRWRPGRGCRSTHTWRDFNGLLRVLTDLGCQVKGDFTITDEADGFERPDHVSARTLLAEMSRREDVARWAAK